MDGVYDLQLRNGHANLSVSRDYVGTSGAMSRDTADVQEFMQQHGRRQGLSSHIKKRAPLNLTYAPWETERRVQEVRGTLPFGVSIASLVRIELAAHLRDSLAEHSNCPPLHDRDLLLFSPRQQQLLHASKANHIPKGHTRISRTLYPVPPRGISAQVPMTEIFSNTLACAYAPNYRFPFMSSDHAKYQAGIDPLCLLRHVIQYRL